MTKKEKLVDEWSQLYKTYNMLLAKYKNIHWTDNTPEMCNPIYFSQYKVCVMEHTIKLWKTRIFTMMNDILIYEQDANRN